jgi:type II secretory pathway pseudopilin PulG
MAEDLETQERPVSPVGRVSHSFLHRRWPEFAVEFVLIIVGILAALYIDGWMQARQDRKSEQAYLELLREDLDLIEGELQGYVDFEATNVETGSATYAMLDVEDPSAGYAKIQLNLALLSARKTLQITSATYTDLQSTGNLQLIRNQDLRQSIVRYFVRTERTELVIEKNNGAFIDDLYDGFLFDMGITSVSLASHDPVLSAANRLFLEAMGSDFEAPRDEALLRPAGATSWDDIRRQVIFRTRVAAVGVTSGRTAIELTRELRAEIEAELQNPI